MDSNRPVLGDLNAGETALFVCDLQEKFRPHIQYFSEIVEGAKRLIQAAELLEIPIIVTEQYPKGLGSTVPELDISKAAGVFPKTKFSMLIPDVEEKIKHVNIGRNISTVVLCGIETHVCVQQTAIDLLKKGISVHVVADACSSRAQTDRVFAIERLRQAGAVVTTTESVILQLVGDKDHPLFKPVQKLIMQSLPTSFPKL